MLRKFCGNSAEILRERKMASIRDTGHVSFEVFSPEDASTCFVGEGLEQGDGAKAVGRACRGMTDRLTCAATTAPKQ
jgi:hypothetical protein